MKMQMANLLSINKIEISTEVVTSKAFVSFLVLSARPVMLLIIY